MIPDTLSFPNVRIVFTPLTTTWSSPPTGENLSGCGGGAILPLGEMP